MTGAPPSPSSDGDPDSKDGRPASGLFGSVLRNTSLLLGGKLAKAVISLGYTALAARALGVEQFGVLMLIHAFAQALGEFAQFQSWQLVLHYGARPLGENRLVQFQRVLRLSLLLDLLSAVGGVAAGMLLAWLVGTKLGWTAEATPAAMAYSLVIAFMASTTATGILRLLDQFRTLALQNGMGPTVRLVGAAVAWALGGDVTVFLAIWFVAEIADFAMLAVIAWRELGRRGYLAGFTWRPSVPDPPLPGAWRFAWATNFNASLSLAFTHLGTLVVGSMLGATEAGLYRVARQVGDSLAKPARLATPALYPELARLWAQNKVTELYRLVLQVAGTAGGVGLLSLAVSVLLGEFLLRTVIGPEFAAAAPLMNWLVAAAALTIWALPLEPMMISTGRAVTALRIRAAVTAIYVPVLFFALDRAGSLGAGYAAAAASLLLLLAQAAGAFRRPRGAPPSPA